MTTLQTGSALQVCESLLAEHRQMEQFLVSLENLMSHPSKQMDTEVETNQELLQTLCHEMNIHFTCEEQALFPAVSPYHPMVLMEVEHEELMALRNELMTRFNEQRFAEFQETGRQFIEEMRDHIAREDGGIFPTCEQALSTEEKQQVIEGMNQIRAKAKSEAVPEFVRPEKTMELLQMNLDTVPARPLMVELLAEKPGVQVKHLTIRAGESLASHWTPKRLLVWSVSGEALFTAEKENPLELKPGTGVLLDPQLNHAIQARTDCHFLLILQDP